MKTGDRWGSNGEWVAGLERVLEGLDVEVDWIVDPLIGLFAVPSGEPCLERVAGFGDVALVVEAAELGQALGGGLVEQVPTATEIDPREQKSRSGFPERLLRF